jgi:hypothetical protein
MFVEYMKLADNSLQKKDTHLKLIITLQVILFTISINH